MGLPEVGAHHVGVPHGLARGAGGDDLALIYMVSCCARSTILRSRMDLEVDAVRSVLGREAPIFGYYAGGEIAPLLSHYEDAADAGREFSGSLYHTTTVCLLALCGAKPARAVVPSSRRSRRPGRGSTRRLISVFPFTRAGFSPPARRPDTNRSARAQGRRAVEWSLGSPERKAGPGALVRRRSWRPRWCHRRRTGTDGRARRASVRAYPMAAHGDASTAGASGGS